MSAYRYVGLAVLLAKGRHATEQAVTDCAEDFVGKVQNVPEMPVDTGTLRAGVHVAVVQRSGNTVTAIVATGGESDEYSVVQYQGSSRGVPATYFMSAPLTRQADTYRKFMQQAVDEAF